MTITTDVRSENRNGSARRRLPLQTESMLTVAAGATIAGLGAWRRGWAGIGLAGSGSYLMYRGIRDLRRPYQGSVRVGFTIGKQRQEIYDFVSNPQNWPRFLHAIELSPSGADQMRLAIGKPAGIDFESHIEVTDLAPGEYVAWASDEQMLQHRGVIHFKDAPGDRGTEVSVALEYKAPAGPIARSLALLVGWTPEQVVRESLRRLKQLLEAGEIPTTEGQPVGARGMKGAALRILYRERPSEVPTAQRGEERLAG